MNVLWLMFGIVVLAYSIAGIELYAKLVFHFRGQPIVVLFYLAWVALFVIGPMFIIDYASRNVTRLSFSDGFPAFVLWLFGFAGYVFLVRRKHLMKVFGPPS